MKEPKIFDIPISQFTSKEILEYISINIKNKKKVTILSGNIHSFNLAYLNPWLKNYMKIVDLIRLDGEGIRLVCRMSGYKMPLRSTWADFGLELANYSSINNFSIFFLGGEKNIAKIASKKMKDKFSNLNISGYHHGYFNKNIKSEENNNIIKMINNSNSNILIVGFGMPIQEKWLLENRKKINVSIVMTGGAVFDYLSGSINRGPKLLINSGNEWLARLSVEPKRLWKRYFFGIPLFFLRFLSYKIKKKFL